MAYETEVCMLLTNLSHDPSFREIITMHIAGHFLFIIDTWQQLTSRYMLPCKSEDLYHVKVKKNIKIYIVSYVSFVFQLQRAAKLLDTGAVRATRFLWRHPVARISLLFYLARTAQLLFPALFFWVCLLSSD
jgi:hypothetical protein